MKRRILVLGEGATELRAPGERWTGCAWVLISRLFGAPPGDLLEFELQVLSRFRQDLDLRDDGDLRIRGEDAQARIARRLASLDSHGLVLVRDNDQSARRPHGDRRAAVERGFVQAQDRGHCVPAVLALAIECIEAWALVDPDSWRQAFGIVPVLPSDPEALWGDVRDPSSNHPKCVLRRCFEEIGRKPAGNAVALLLEHASLRLLAERCPLGFGRFVADLQLAFPQIECVVAASADRAIALGGEPPWGFDTLRDHVGYVRGLVTAASGSHCAVVVGRKAWPLLRALPPLPERVDIVVTRNAGYELPAHVLRASSFDDALNHATAKQVRCVYVLGGGELYREALGHFRCTTVHYTRVEQEVAGADAFFPALDATAGWRCAPAATQHHDNGFDYRMERWSRFA